MNSFSNDPESSRQGFTKRLERKLPDSSYITAHPEVETSGHVAALQ
jgi:hypothetical protein